VDNFKKTAGAGALSEAKKYPWGTPPYINSTNPTEKFKNRFHPSVFSGSKPPKNPPLLIGEAERNSRFNKKRALHSEALF